MNEKKTFEMNDDILRNVTGGQEDNSPSYADTVFNKKFEDPNAIYLTCPECGSFLNIVTYKGSSGTTTMSGPCPHCKKIVTVTV